MSYETVEAIQAELIGVGVILVPGTPDKPPEWLDDAYIHMLETRVFPHANPSGPVFYYKQNVPYGRWHLIKSSGGAGSDAR